jgi:hypothetical protein
VQVKRGSRSSVPKPSHPRGIHRPGEVGGRAVPRCRNCRREA